ncbi:putative aldo-keto reductase [Amniculicola lignicola CBS 123094]|uniref:Putative aldo-keto reductase n=1 Tax=Amniculicola lignicola CBS 123094 TaxID=1392246 RepID=A0A6A5WM52_9PLEO|nr:putative aldo-keto reductase [Amniculicola lignicola CBS 123094]
MAPNKTITLASGHEMPLVGFGLWKVPADQAADTVYNAVTAGYRLFDGAYDYQNEKEAGQGIQRAIKDGLVKREDVFVTTKLWNNYHAKEHAIPMMKAQNEAWGLGYIDLFLIHFPVALEYIDPEKVRYPVWWMEDKSVRTAKVSIRETWECMEAIVDSGIAKSIGVSNFQAQSLYDIQSYLKHPISALQIEHHPYLVQPELIKMAQKHNIAVTAYSSFGPQSYVELENARAQDTKVLFEAEVVKGIAETHNVTPAQILLRWATQRNIAVIPKSNNPERMAQNLSVLEFDLVSNEIEMISGLNQGLRFNDPAFYLPENPLYIFA